ncbi:AMP-binding protein [Intrasporangium sp. YIM S08009]|uniref:AMP-binding protein n=1 Tax=Intrasporangium zincisolvens TaxID=3080018 RepID=UPI002B061584|nr:AMP-binding protein [Intrasporangium sp. YIM S08009]
MTATALPLRPAAGLPWVSRLHEHGTRTALHTDAGPVTYADLARRVDDLAHRLAGSRRLVLVEGRSTVETVVAHLAALRAGHVVLLTAPGEAAQRLAAAYDPDVVLDASGGLDERRAESAHELHPDLALLLSTSGSTGSAKLVRLSHDNLAANTAQIDAALGVRTDDCAALTLPLTYCYGLSVLTTHLARGAAVLLTDRSVVDECFWTRFRAVGGTTFPGVPHTFELLERSGFAQRDLPTLRYVTQAGGRMDPARVRRLAELGQERGFDLVVMYGQCEATARMTYLPPDLAVDHPDTVGRPVPGASVEVEDGEIVFRGPNVMLGYAHGPDDLALGRTVDALRTGDLGEVTPEGLVRVTGRRARFVKVLGHRVDLDALEGRLRDEGHDVRCAGRDGLVAVAACGAVAAPARETLRRTAIRACGVPREALRVVPVADHPVLASGKPDYRTVLALACEDCPARPDVAPDASPDATHDAAVPERAVAAVYGRLLQRKVADDATFVSLGGDSLSYVEVSIRLEQLLGRLPESWHVTPVAHLERMRATTTSSATPGAGAAPSPTHASNRLWHSLTRGASRARWRTVETGVWLRALAIVLIVGTHAGLFALQGTANALLVVAGYQLARFQLADADRRRRTRRVLGAAVRIAVPALVVIVFAHALVGDYETRNLFLANWVFGQERLGPPWRFWFVEAMVVALVAVAVLTASRRVAALDRRYPFGLPLALSAAAFVLFRLPVLPLPVPRMHGSALVVLHLFLLGWALARATTPTQRRVATVVAVAMVGTFSFNPARDGLTAAFVLLLLWRPVTRVPARFVPVVQVLASASLYVYVVHWQALELLWGHPVPAFAGSMALGLAYWWVWTRPVTAAWRAALAHVGRSRVATRVRSRVATRVPSRIRPRVGWSARTDAGARREVRPRAAAG